MRKSSGGKGQAASELPEQGGPTGRREKKRSKRARQSAERGGSIELAINRASDTLGENIAAL